MATAKAGTELAVLGDSYAIARVDGGAANVMEVMRENLGNQGASVFDLDRVRVPSGGGTAWEVPTLDGLEPSKHVEGIIVHWREPRAYWKLSLDESGGGVPPDCSSVDGVFGVGDPGGQCVRCPLAAFNTAPPKTPGGEPGRGQACKQMRLLFLLRPTDLLPLAIFAPPTSLGNLRKYFLRLASAGAPYYSVVTRLGLEKTNNAGGIEYAQIVPEVATRINPADIATIKEYSASIQSTLDAVQVTDDDLATAEADAAPVS